MKYTRLIKSIAALAMLFGGIGTLPAAVTLTIDMDTLTPGIQSIRTAAVNEVFDIGLVMTAGAEGVSSYGVSVNFDNAELMLNGVTDLLSATELLPAGFTFNFGAGVASASQALGRVYTFEAGTFGLGPVSSSFTIGTINFKAITPITDGFLDVTPGLFNIGVDGIFDNAGVDLGPGATFIGGTVNIAVPEPSRAVLLAGGMAMMLAVRRRRSI